MGCNMKKIQSLAVLVALLAALSGCASGPAPMPSASVSVEPILGDLDGDGALSSDEKKKLPVREYVMPDGSVVPIYRDQPAPPEVVDAAKAVIAPLAAIVSARGMFDPPDADAAMWDEVENQNALMGKTIIAVFYGYGYDGRAWVTSTPVAEQFATKEEAIARAQTYMGDSAYKFALIVFD